jgi:hypothetical protein
MYRFICLLMALTIVVGYTGIPVYKMICLEDGHTSISISEQPGECHHNLVQKDCCTPKHIAQKPTESCCAGASSFFRLHETTEIFPTQSSTGHILHASVFLHVAFNFNHHAVVSRNICAYNSPPPLLRKQPVQSIIQVFLI